MNNKEYIAAVRDAMENGNLLNVDFYKDGSGAYFHIKNNVTSETRGISLCIEDAIECLRGFRLIQHNIIHCA